MKKSVCKKALSLVLALVLCFSVFAVSDCMVTETRALTQNQQNIVNRADYLYSIEWVAQKTVTAHAYSSYYTFYAGNTYHLPYGQGSVSNYIGYGVTPAYFEQVAADANSEFYQYKCYAGTWYSTYYITDCSGFVSWCWGLTAKQSTRSLANYSTYVASVTTSNIYNYLQVGDALNRYDYHVVLVTDMIYDSSGTLTGIEITEQNIPQMQRAIYSPSGLASAFASYDGIYRYNGTVPESPVVVEQEKEETWVEKACFDTMVYRDRNPDLADMTDAELKEHWLNYGIKEGRASSTILDLGFYLNNNQDLKEAFGTDYEALYNHFITSGYKEYRKSSALFDGSYYVEKNPDVAASFKEEYLRHYVESGMAEGRRASLTFDPDYYWYIRPDVYEAWPDDYAMCAKHYAGHGINAQIEAYDHSSPVISDATISNVTASGYTVSCTVTDDWGLSKVSFPTWTLLNDQDDLAADFMNTQQGTVSGNTYTFTVNASDHNNETGYYVTHIYAVDKGGNQVQLVLDPVEVKDSVTVDPTPDSGSDTGTNSGAITLTTAASYSRQGTLLKKVTSDTAVQSLLMQFQNESLQVLDNSGSVISGTELVGTGATINLYSGNVLMDTVTVVVLGDVDGNAKVNSTDYMRIKSAFLNSFTLGTAETSAADVDENNKIDSTDYMRIKSQFLGTYDLYA